MPQYDMNLREYWRILHKRKTSVLLTAIILGTFSTIFAVMRAPVPLYTSTCTIKFQRDTTVEGVYARTISWYDKTDVETMMSLLKSYSVILEAAKRLGKVPDGTSTQDLSLRPDIVETITDLQSKVEVSQEEFTNIINIKVIDTDPSFAQDLANKIALTYKEIHTAEQNRRAKEALEYIAQQLQAARQNLRESEDEFSKFERKNQLVSIDLQSESLLSMAREIRDETRKLGEAKGELDEVVAKLQGFIQNPSGSGKEFYAHSDYATKGYQDANGTLVKLLLRRDSLLKDFTAKHPEIIAMKREIIEVARRMMIIAGLQIDSVDKRRADLEKRLAEVNRKTDELMEKRLEYNRLRRKVDSYNDMVALLEQKNQEASIRMAERPEEVTMVKPALLPRTPINPPKTVATGAIGILMGLILGLVLGFVLETFDTSLAAIEDVEETLGTQVLGIVLHGDVKSIEEAVKEKGETEGGQAETEMSPFRRSMQLVSHFAPQSVLAESFRALRTNVQFRGVEKKIKTLTITSTSPQEGKTTISCNLAIAMAQAGRKTLLVESDFRKPGISKGFGIEISPGLTDVILGNYSFGDVVKTVTDIIVGKMNVDDVMFTPGLDNLHIVTSGTMPPNPAELIGSNQLAEFVEGVKRDYNVVIFDAPPVLSAADAAILGSKSDAVLLIYRVGSVSKGLLKRSAVQLTQAKCNIIGVVLNDMKASVSPDFQGFKYYQYYYSYTEKAEEEKKGRWKSLLPKIGKRRPKKKPAKKKMESLMTSIPSRHTRAKRTGASSKLILPILAAGLLTGGLLWQNGVLSVDTNPSGQQDVFEADDKTASPEKQPQPHVRRVIPAADSVVTVAAIPDKASSTETLSETKTVLFVKQAGLAPDPAKAKRSPTGRASSEQSLPETRPLPNVKGATSVPDSPKAKRSSLEADASADRSLSNAVAYATPHKRYPYTLRVASFRRFRDVGQEMNALKDKGLSPYWTHMDMGKKGKWVGVFVGHFVTSGKGIEFRRRHGLEGSIVSKTPHTVEIGTDWSEKVMKHNTPAPRRMGGSPYFIEKAKGGQRLLIGAFRTQGAARELAQRLRETGIDCTAVLR